MDVDNATADISFGPGINVFYIATPWVGAKFTFFCEQPGHRTIGEEGTLYIGSGPPGESNNLSFFVILFIGLFIVVLIVVVNSRVKNMGSNLKNNSFETKSNRYDYSHIHRPVNSPKRNFFCNKCGSISYSGDVFCQNCGTRLI